MFKKKLKRKSILSNKQDNKPKGWRVFWNELWFLTVRNQESGLWIHIYNKFAAVFLFGVLFPLNVCPQFTGRWHKIPPDWLNVYLIYKKKPKRWSHPLTDPPEKATPATLPLLALFLSGSSWKRRKWVMKMEKNDWFTQTRGDILVTTCRVRKPKTLSYQKPFKMLFLMWRRRNWLKEGRHFMPKVNILGFLCAQINTHSA